MSNDPQLQMIRPNLRDLPDLAIPAPFELCHWQPGMGPAWTEIISSSFSEPPENYLFDKIMRADRAFAPTRVLFITHQGQPVATASAWHNPAHNPHVGIIHYVGVLPSWQGHKLGYWATVAALHQMVKEQRSQAHLLTDDHRLPAIKTYTRLGFCPMLDHPSYPARWETIAQQLPDMHFHGVS